MAGSPSRLSSLSLVLLLVLTACGDDDGTSPSTSGSTTTTTTSLATGGDPAADGPCRLIDLAVVSAFTGAEAMVGYNDERTCRVDAQTGQPIEPSLSVTLYPGSTMSDYETARDSRASAVEYGGPSLAAYYDAELQLVQFFGGELMVGVQLVGGDFDAAAIETFVKAQAATVAARL